MGLKTGLLTVGVTNTGQTGLTITRFQLDSPAFQVTQGIAPVKLNSGDTTHYTIQFAPTRVQSYTGHFTVYLNDGETATLTMTGKGQTTNAQASLSSNLMDFGTVTQGQVVASKTLTITNTGTQSFSIESATTQPPFSIPFVDVTTIPPGGSLPIPVTFYPSRVGTPNQLIVLTYDTLPAQGVNLTGTVVPPGTLAASTFPILPSATQQANYMGYLAAAGGTPPYTWSLQDGSTLPPGLSLSSDGGFISGKLDPAVNTGVYSFGVSVNDSSVPPQSASQQLSLSVGAPTGAICDNISWNVSGTNSPIQGLDVLGTGSYLGAQGGLYPNGSNVRPADHTAFGQTLAQGIQPLNAQGQPDPNGKEVIVILGESNVEIEGEGISADAAADPVKNPAVVVVNAALGDGTAANLSRRTSGFWSTINNYIIPNYGVTPNQVVAAWLEPTDALNKGTFPSDISQLQSQIENEVRNLQFFYPNIKLAYISSRIYSGYSNGLNTINPEPYAFESGYAIKWAIQDQLSGKSNLNFDPSKGPVVAPWMSWGPYTWADGLVVPTTAGYTWSCQDQKDDGTHPNKTTGKEEVANQVLNFFKTDVTTTPWYLSPK